ncbi:MAG: YqaE/Pmp3 family membrane protein [Flavobacteriales bacterium]
MKNIYFLAIAAIILSLGSCTIEKRHYQSGYHVEWNHRNKPVEKAEEVKANQPEQESTASNETPVLQEEMATEELAILPSTSVPQADESTATLNEEPVYKKQSATQKLTERAEAKETTQFKPAQEENLNSENRGNAESQNKSKQVEDIVLILLCIFIPPLAVYLYEGDTTVNFWVDLLLWLTIIGGMIFAFLVCFAGVSL